MTDADFEASLREQLTSAALDREPSGVPVEAIRREGRAARRRRAVAFSVGLAALLALPTAAFALNTQWNTTAVVAGPAVGGTAKPSAPSASAGSATPSASPTPAGPGRPASPGQLVDGITYEQAVTALSQCLDFYKTKEAGFLGGRSEDLGTPGEYRILLAMKSTGDDNSPGDGINVVAIRQTPQLTRIICHQVGGRTSGFNIGGNPRAGGPAGLVNPDINGGKLYREQMVNGDPWKLPYRWGSIGTFDPAVAKVTVSYGSGPAVEAALDHGWFAATGILDDSVTKAPHIKGYDAGGKLVYDSDDDKGYNKDL